MQDFNFLQDSVDLNSKQPAFAWISPDQFSPEAPEIIFQVDNSRDAVRNLMFSMLMYQLHRHKMYVDYMRGAKILFGLSNWEHLRRPCKLYLAHHEEYLANRGSAEPKPDWCPHYELQRLHLHTGIHWTWLHWAWVKCEQAIWKGSQSWQIKRLERKPFL